MATDRRVIFFVENLFCTVRNHNFSIISQSTYYQVYNIDVVVSINKFNNIYIPDENYCNIRFKYY